MGVPAAAGAILDQQGAPDGTMTTHTIRIAVALPLEASNREAAREQSIRHGHPLTLHLWWARRSLAACRAAAGTGEGTARPFKEEGPGCLAWRRETGYCFFCEKDLWIVSV